MRSIPYTYILFKFHFYFTILSFNRMEGCMPKYALKLWEKCEKLSNPKSNRNSDGLIFFFFNEYISFFQSLCQQPFSECRTKHF